MSSTNWTFRSITQISGPSTSRIWLTVSDISPQKIEACWAIRTAANTTPKMIPRYLTRLPTSIFQAIQSMTAFPRRKAAHPARSAYP
jgi:hypothetical protein